MNPQKKRLWLKLVFLFIPAMVLLALGERFLIDYLEGRGIGVNLLERDKRLLVEHIGLLRESFRQVWRLRPFSIEAIAVLPDHLHCIWTLPPDDSDFSTRWRRIKGLFAQGIAAGERLSERRLAKNERGIWQRRFWEHMIRDERDYTVHADYIHYNPVKHGYAKCAADWPYSSFHRFVRAGVYPIDWAADWAVREFDRE
ncbi:MAG: transposase [Nevskia sp.]|nr:transposase [Nevskia sp.]